MNLLNIIVIILSHWVGDFLLQNYEMATKKSKSLYWLSKHVAAYAMVISLCIISLLGITIPAFVWVGINVVLHWITDYFTSKWTSKLYTEKKFYGFPAFFSVIGLDQLIHYICLFTTYYWLC